MSERDSLDWMGESRIVELGDGIQFIAQDEEYGKRVSLAKTGAPGLWFTIPADKRNAVAAAIAPAPPAPEFPPNPWHGAFDVLCKIAAGTPLTVDEFRAVGDSFGLAREQIGAAALTFPSQPPAPEAITVQMSREEAELAADAVNHQAVLREIDLDCVIDGPAKKELALEHARLLRALAAIESALAPGAAADAGEDGGA